MYCQNCGTEIPDNQSSCPKCNTAVPTPQVQNQQAAEKDNSFNDIKFFKSPTKGGKSSAAIITALTLIPSVFILMFDYVWNLKIDNPATGYIVGALIVIWICGFLPSINVTPAPVTAMICFIAAASYVLFLVKQITGNLEWFVAFALPILAILTIFTTLNTALTRSGKISGMWVWTLTSFEGACFSIIWKMLWENYYGPSEIMPRLCIICGTALLMLSILLAAAAYIHTVNKKD